MRGFSTRHIVWPFAATLAFLLGTFSTALQAAPVQVTFDLTTGSTTTVATEIGSGDGNHYEFFDPVAPNTLRAYGWSDVGGPTMVASEVTQFGTVASICNPAEDVTVFIFTLPCNWFQAPRSVDNGGGQRDCPIPFCCLSTASTGSLDLLVPLVSRDRKLL
ncbi:MAG: hypothetical protein QF790_04850 [Gammaproteobacteria bacterium]|jgi:hypothetical protein|nr:hypothetical protein [Gammaproteobacteria bacterium]MDP6616477.1 hypothetical protein [Gammaproteobacteria bacterium]MDP6694275.1 hypothetical protein [Gammaproteobacteria bacterium]MDP7041302.1 hypothetical protein [Gammaproteobacteria bacterium]